MHSLWEVHYSPVIHFEHITKRIYAIALGDIAIWTVQFMEVCVNGIAMMLMFTNARVAAIEDSTGTAISLS